MKLRVVIAALVFAAVAWSPVYAEASNTRGIGLSPGMQELELRAGDESVGFSVTVTNLTEDTVSLRLSLLDFGALDETGGVAFLGRSSQDAGNYGLRQWMRLDKDRFALEPGQSEEVRATITNQDTLSPGGHYGAVVVSVAGSGTSGGESVAVQPAASTLVLLKKIGGEIESLELESINTNKSLLRLPKSAELKFKNSGNIHLVPRGTIELFGPTGKKISRSAINETSAYVLPDSARLFKQDLPGVSQPWLPGKYRLAVSWRYDGNDEVVTVEQTYWYVGKLVTYLLVSGSTVIVLVLYIRYRRRPPSRY